MDKNKTNQLIEKLEKLTGKKIVILERDIDKGTKKNFYLATSEFERALNRLKKFYVSQSSVHPELKSFSKRVEKLEELFNDVFKLTETYLNEPEKEETKPQGLNQQYNTFS
jgi:uncharacterized protein (UPF0335 family)